MATEHCLHPHHTDEVSGRWYPFVVGIEIQITQAILKENYNKSIDFDF